MISALIDSRDKVTHALRSMPEIDRSNFGSSPSPSLKHVSQAFAPRQMANPIPNTTFRIGYF